MRSSISERIYVSLTSVLNLLFILVLLFSPTSLSARGNGPEPAESHQSVQNRNLNIAIIGKQHFELPKKHLNIAEIRRFAENPSPNTRGSGNSKLPAAVIDSIKRNGSSLSSEARIHLYVTNINGSRNRTHVADTVKAIEWILNGIQAPIDAVQINLSGFHSFQKTQLNTLRKAIHRVHASGIPVITPAGFPAGTGTDVPASFPETIAVSPGVLTPEKRSPVISETSADLRTSTPGANTQTTAPDQQATSRSVSRVAGASALIHQQQPAISPDQLKQLLRSTGLTNKGSELPILQTGRALDTLPESVQNTRRLSRKLPHNPPIHRPPVPPEPFPPRPDFDRDGVLDGFDNCPYTYNPLQKDQDLDGVGDACEQTKEENPEQQVSTTQNRRPAPPRPIPRPPNPPEFDIDHDGVPDALDNCPLRYNPMQRDSDQDGIGDRCDDKNNQSKPDKDPKNKDQT